MERNRFRSLLRERVLILDGGMGVLLQGSGLAPGEAPEAFLLKHPETIQEAHGAYARAGSDVLLTCTFGASPIRLAESGLDARCAEINELAVRVAREAAGGDLLVAGDVGPSGRFLEPVGDLTFEGAYANFREQGLALARAGADLIIVETISDLREAKAAVVALRDVFQGPIVVQMTFSADGRTVTGTDALTAHTVLSNFDVDAVGVNCSVGPAAMLPVVEVLCGASEMPVSVEPNAGLPELVDGRSVFPDSDEVLAEYAERFHAAGANLLGGCCGTTPKTIAAIAARLRGRPPAPRPKMPDGLRLASRTRTRIFLPSDPCAIVGERLNPTGRALFSQRLKEGDLSVLRKDALDQASRGADVLDLNCGVPGVDEGALLGRAVAYLEAAVDTPIVVDTSHPEALESALRMSSGRVLINSANGEESSMERIFPLARRYGAAVLGLCLDERGIPASVGGRMEIARRLLRRAEAHGLTRNDLVVDALTLTLSTQPKGARTTLETLRAIRDDLGLRTILGVSNISFGLPARPALNAAFLVQAVEAGLTLAIINPLDGGMLQALHAANLLSGRDPGCSAYIGHFAPRSPDPLDADPGMEGRLRRAVVEGDREGIVDLVKTALGSGMPPYQITREGLVRGMEIVGERFASGAVFLPHVILSAETLQRAFGYIKERLPASARQSKGKVIFATVQGDIHDIGKNICITLLQNSGYEVVDLGKNARADEILDAAEREGAGIVALSALMTTTMQRMSEVTLLARERGMKVKVLVGGAVVTDSYARSIGADGYGKDAVECVKLADLVVGNRD
jgi:5-methyltetrahydrofolate--homocysteine methyltransferase